MEQILWKKKEYIGPGNIGTQKTLTLWNKASDVVLGTNKTNTLRLDQYTQREEITNQYKNSKVLACNPHDEQFESINKLPKINSKYRNTYQHEIKKTIGRQGHGSQPTEFYKPHKNGNDVNVGAPNSPANTAFYNTEIPKFYPGQPGYKKHLRQVQMEIIHQTKPMVEWDSDLWGEIKRPKIYNIPGFQKDKLMAKKVSVQYLQLLKTAVEDEDNFGEFVQKPNSPVEKSHYITQDNFATEEENQN